MAASRLRSPLPVLFSIVVVDLIGFGIVLPVLPFYAESMGATATVLGLLVASYAALQFLCAPLWGRLSDRIGRRPVMLATIAGTALALVLLGLAESLPWLFAARILGGAFGANISVASAYIGDVTSEADRTRWMGMLGASFGVGFLLGPAVGGLLAPYGYGVPMLVAAGLAAVNGLYAAIVLKEPPERVASEDADGAVAPRRARALSIPLVRRLCLGNLAFALAVTQLETVFAYFMMDRFDYDARRVAFVLVLMALVAVVIQGGGIRSLAARFGERQLLVGGAALMAASFLVVPFSATVPVLLVPLVLASVGRGVSQPSMMGLVSAASSRDNRGAVMGAYQSAASLARVVGPVVAGVLYDTSQGAPFWLASVLLVGVLALGAGLPVARAGETAPAPAPPAV